MNKDKKKYIKENKGCISCLTIIIVVVLGYNILNNYYDNRTEEFNYNVSIANDTTLQLNKRLSLLKHALSLADNDRLRCSVLERLIFLYSTTNQPDSVLCYLNQYKDIYDFFYLYQTFSVDNSTQRWHPFYYTDIDLLRARMYELKNEKKKSFYILDSIIQTKPKYESMGVFSKIWHLFLRNADEEKENRLHQYYFDYFAHLSAMEMYVNSLNDSVQMINILERVIHISEDLDEVSNEYKKNIKEKQNNIINASLKGDMSFSPMDLITQAYRGKWILLNLYLLLSDKYFGYDKTNNRLINLNAYKQKSTESFLKCLFNYYQYVKTDIDKNKMPYSEFHKLNIDPFLVSNIVVLKPIDARINPGNLSQLTINGIKGSAVLVKFNNYNYLDSCQIFVSDSVFKYKGRIKKITLLDNNNCFKNIEVKSDSLGVTINNLSVPSMILKFLAYDYKNEN